MKGQTTTVKVQLPLAWSVTDEPRAYVYDQHRSIEAFLEVTAELRQIMRDRPKVYFLASVVEGRCFLIQEVEQQPW